MQSLLNLIINMENIKLDFHDAISNVSELGVLIGNKNYWGKGVKEACNLVLDYGFNVLKLRKIFLAVFENNVAAIKLYKSADLNWRKLKKSIYQLMVLIMINILWEFLEIII